MKKFLAELKRRNVYKVAAAYAAIGWLLIEVVTQVFPIFGIPNWVVRLVVLLVGLGLPVALLIAWAFEITPAGIKRTAQADELPRSSSRRPRTWIYVVLFAALLSAGTFFLGRRISVPPPSKPAVVPEKSIAFLPFEIWSGEPANSSLTTGIQN